MTTIRRPNRERFSNHASASCRPTTGPTIVVTGDTMRSRRATSATVSSVATTVRWPGVVPRSTRATGSSRGRPYRIKRAAMSAKEDAPIRRTKVSAPCARAENRSSEPGRGDASCPVMTANDDANPPCVTGIPARAGTAIAALTPGTISNAMPAAASAWPSSAPRPNTKGSPPLRRTTRFPARALDTINASIAAWGIWVSPGILPTKWRSAASGASATRAKATRRSNRTTSQVRRKPRPRLVISPGSPGPRRPGKL